MTDSHHRGPRPEPAAAFDHVGLAGAYRFRPPYPAGVFDVLEGLLDPQPREPARVLDVGAGEGALARPLITRGRVARLDAVDASAAMIEAGRERPGGGHPGLRWILGAVDQVPLNGPYCLAVAGASLHWMSWKRTMARLAEVLTDDGVLAVVEHGYHRLPWRDALNEVIADHSRSPEFDPRFSIVDELTARGLFRKTGEHRTISESFHQSIAEYVEQFHHSAEDPDTTEDLDTAVERIVRPYAVDGVLTIDVAASVVWGRPLGLSSLPTRSRATSD